MTKTNTPDHTAGLKKTEPCAKAQALLDRLSESQLNEIIPTWSQHAPGTIFGVDAGQLLERRLTVRESLKLAATGWITVHVGPNRKYAVNLIDYLTA
jgi:hypothetical protein